MKVGGAMRQRQITTPRKRITQRRNDLPGLLCVGKEVNDRDQHQPDRLSEIDQLAGLRITQDPRGIAQVANTVPVLPWPVSKAFACT